MSNKNKTSINIDVGEISELLGYKDTNPDEEITEIIEEEITRCMKAIKPEVFWKKLKIQDISENHVELENGIVFEVQYISGKLNGCSYIVILAATVGEAIDSYTRETFASGDYIRSMIIDNIAVIALNKIMKSFWISLIDDLKGTNIGITKRLSPGENEWKIEDQKKIFECLKGVCKGISLTESNMMVPIKSVTAVYGFGKDIGISREEHLCSECRMINCTYRTEKRIEIIVDYKGERKKIKTPRGTNLFSALRSKNIFLPGSCNGNGTCGKCRININKGTIEASMIDEKHLSRIEIENGTRLACGITVEDHLEITIEDTDKKMQVMIEGKDENISVDPVVVKKHLVMKKPDFNDQRDDFKRLWDSSEIEDLSIDLMLIRDIGRNLREADFDVTLSTYGTKLIRIEAGNTLERMYGIAADIGTTTVACYLINLRNGRTIDTEARVNNQRAYGDDVISRINYTIGNAEGTEILRKLIINQLNNMIGELCTRNYIKCDDIYNMSVAGNTIMLHFLLGIETANIAHAPYIPVFTEAFDFIASDIGININGYVSILPCISAYVGGDITGGILATELMDSENYSLLIDLGTNGEIVLGNSKGTVACSTAAGPVFEGANIKNGIGGVYGAISKVNLGENPAIKTIGGGPPCGICGSGVLDTVSEFVKLGIIDETGRMLDKDEIDNDILKDKIIDTDHGKEFLIAENPSGVKNITFTQRDVREVQLAKAAISAGIKLLMDEKGLTCNDIENVYLGGGFGNFMDIESAFNIGMLPLGLKGKICSVGNCAGMGAKQYLLSAKTRKKVKELISRVTYVELSNRKDFQDYYLDSMMLQVQEE